MNEEEKRKYESFQYWIETNTEKGVATIPDNLCIFIINLIKKLQKENKNYEEQIKNEDKIIQNMSKYILSLDIDKDICMKNTTNTELCNEDNSNCVECIRKHFSN